MIQVRLLLLSLWIVAISSFTSLSPSSSRSSRSLLMHFEEATIGKSQLPTNALPANRYLATNRFHVRQNAMAKFEKRWADRKSRLSLLPGFRFFALLKRVSLFGVKYNSDDELGNYISFTYWDTKEDFDRWRKGDAFKEAHGGGGIVDFVKLITTALFIVKGSPKPAFFDALLYKIGERMSFDAVDGWRKVNADGISLLQPDVFVAQNRFKVLPGKELQFEQHWANRESQLHNVSGFYSFSLLRRDADQADDGFNYISCSIWKDAESFKAWKESENFQAAHASASLSSQEKPKLYVESPVISFYEGKLALANANGI